MKIISSIYRSARVEGMYLYVDKAEGLARVPEALLAQFGKPEHAMTLLLHAERKLANADIGKVIEAVRQQGFYLQMPPRDDEAAE